MLSLILGTKWQVWALSLSQYKYNILICVSSLILLTPFATLFLAVGLEATRLGYRRSDNVAPLINQANELCYSHSLNDVRQKIIMARHRYWIPQIADSEFCLNNRSKCQLIRRAKGDFVEP